MIFKSVRIKEGLSERKISFSEGVNLIHSDENSCGKTTLLRFMLYSLGYNIPNTKKIRFNRCEVETLLDTEAIGEVSLLRYSDDFLELTSDAGKRTYVLPAQVYELHSILFGTKNTDVLKNLLGAFYTDQEKGWTLLNRGTVIGSIHFNIEELIRGLSGRDCSELTQRQVHLERNISKYRQMFSIAQYREALEAESGSLITEDYEEKTDSQVNQLLVERKSLKSELKRIDQTLTDNKRFRRFVSDLKLLVQSPDGNIIQVTEDNIVGINDAIDLLVAKRKIVSERLSRLELKLEHVQKEQKYELEQLGFLNSETLEDVFDKKIVSMPMNPVTLKKKLNSLAGELKTVREQITDITKKNNDVVTLIYHSIVKYAENLEIGDNTSIATSYLFTSNLKELSGAVLHKTVFAFRLAYIIAIENALNLKLPIILDSPSGKEVDQANIRLMMDILKQDFSDHQLIIASIYEYDFPEVNQIEIVERLLPVVTEERK